MTPFSPSPVIASEAWQSPYHPITLSPLLSFSPLRITNYQLPLVSVGGAGYYILDWLKPSGNSTKTKGLAFENREQKGTQMTRIQHARD